MPSVSWVTSAVFAWISQNSGLLLPEALTIYRYLVLLIVIKLGMEWAITALGQGYRHHILDRAFRSLAEIVAIGFMLKYYNVPSAILGGYSVHQLIPEAGRWVTNLINTANLQNCVTELDKVLAAQPVPNGLLHPIEVAFYFIMLVITWVFEGVLFMLSTVAFIPIGVGILVGPLSIVAYLVPLQMVKGWFWSWLGYLMSWSFFLVVGAALVSIWSSAILYSLGALFHGQYTAIQAVVVVKVMVLLSISFWWTAFRAERIAASLYGSAASAAAGFATRF